jgi:hypothetical protein
MRPRTTVLLACRLSRSGFSGERVFRVTLAGGSGEHVGVAPVDYCKTPDGEPIGDDQPAQKNSEGLVEGLLIENGGDTAHIATPDGETITVDVGQIRFQVSEGAKYVPIRS